MAGGLLSWKSIVVVALTAGLVALVMQPELQVYYDQLSTLVDDKPKSESRVFYTKIEEFYTYYLTQNTDPVNRLMHAVGTGLVALYAVVFPSIFPCAGLAGISGYLAREVFSSMDNGHFELAVMISVFVLASTFISGRPMVLPLILVFGLAVAGHYLFEKNGEDPLYLNYPTFTVASDFKMFVDVLQQKLSVQLPTELPKF